MPDPTRPLEITQLTRTALRVNWADGHLSEYPFPFLRRNCRCAGCSDRDAPPANTNPASTNPFRVLGPEPSAVPAALEQVGHYGLGIHWTDAHYSIYAFDTLRSECPCTACAAGRTPAGAQTSV